MRRHGCNERVMIEKSSVEKDLGVHVDKELKIFRHIETLANKSNKLLGLIRRSYEFLDSEVMKLLFCCCRVPEPRIWKRRAVTET